MRVLLKLVHIVWLAITLTFVATQQAHARPDFTICENLFGPGAGLCKAAMAMNCDEDNSARSCMNVADRYDSLTGEPAPWLDRQGPEIICAGPFDGAILDLPPGSQISFHGSVVDPSGLSQFLVNGAPIAVDASNNFTAEVVTDWGINIVELVATDAVGNQSARSCAFLLSDQWTPNGETLASSISVRGGQELFDDGNRDDELDSMADILSTVLNSPALENQLHAQLLAANPIKNSCDSEVCVPYVGCACLFRSRFDILDLEFGGSRNNSLFLKDGGIENTTRVNDVRIRVGVSGTVDTTGWITYDYVTGTYINDIDLIDDQLHVSVISGSESASVGGVSADFPGFTGLIVDIAFGLFSGHVSNLSESALLDFMRVHLDGVLEDILDNLGVYNLAASFHVPLLDDASDVGISFSSNFTTLNTSSSRMLASLGTKFQIDTVNSRPTLGAPVPPGDRILDIPSIEPLVIGVHDGVFNQVLHALWRGGYFDMSLTGGGLNGLLPPGVNLQLNGFLPPAARLRDDGRFEVAIGSLFADIDYPALLTEPVQASVSARGSCAPGLLGEDLVFDQCMIEELYLSVGTQLIDDNTLTSLELLMTDAISEVLYSVVNDSLPVLPIPGVLLPESLSGGEMGLRNPQLQFEGDHVVLQGQLGLQ